MMIYIMIRLFAFVLIIIVFFIFIADSSSYKMIYLDNNGTTYPYPEVIESAKRNALLGNASGIYATKAKKILDEFEVKVKQILNAPNHYVIITSGASESNNLIIRSCVDKYWRDYNKLPHVLMTEVEHNTSLLCIKTLKANGRCDYSLIPVEIDATINPEIMSSMIRPNTCLVSVMAVNNEVGSLNDVNVLGRLCKERNVPFHSDIVQLFGKLNPPGTESESGDMWNMFRLDMTCINAVSVSFHKLHGPFIGFLVCDIEIVEQISGSQQNKMRGGTEPIANIAAAITCMNVHFENRAMKNVNMKRKIARLRNELSNEIGEISPQLVVGMPDDYNKSMPELQNVTRICFLSPEYAINTLLFSLISDKNFCNIKMRERLYQRGIIVSIGSTCNTIHKEPSHVLLALQLPYFVRCGVLRVSISDKTSMNDLYTFKTTLLELINE